ncbi:effector-associated constant component EACC1 [Nonomuraea glycinis]|uniref:effector-associated constant component EACC1 n=1 Tax=Nonomuraea glycinis TaxID=2047744 RepID=UPI002E0F0173|nr:hypothetical protein OHA68_08000 [Nonomuraea glycinis]
MELTVTAPTGDGNELRGLYARIAADRGLRCTARIVEGEPLPETLGPIIEMLQITLGAGGTIGGVASVVIAWLRNRSSEFTVRLNQNGKEIELTAKGLSTMDSDQIALLTEKVVAALSKQRADGD